MAASADAAGLAGDLRFCGHSDGLGASAVHWFPAQPDAILPRGGRGNAYVKLAEIVVGLFGG
ncbi:MAG: hypothetical protein IH624_19500 [Phycisphaerae bacterium]|nr:hypothetical protein [Phycisphaerae bacterium]